MDKPYSTEDGEFGRRLVLHGAWRDDTLEYMNAWGIRELVVNYAQGFEGKDIAFVEQLPDLEAFWIIHRTIDDISPIHHLRDLRSLKVHTYCRTAIDFSKFPRLERCVLEWRREVSSLYDRPHLKCLLINKYDKKHTNEFARASQLERLFLANAPTEDLRGLADLKRLRTLGLYRLRRLSSLKGIESLQALETLEVQECRQLESLGGVGKLRHLRRLLITDLGEIESISFLRDLRELEEVLFYGSTNVKDGNLSFLTWLPKLRNLSFQNRRHYSHRREQFAQY